MSTVNMKEQGFQTPYPRHNVLDKWSSPDWDDQTREVVRKRLEEVPEIRFFNDEVLVKPPMESGGKATPWHQDLPHAAFDRTGLVNIWISLVDLPADGGAWLSS